MDAAFLPMIIDKEAPITYGDYIAFMERMGLSFQLY